MASKQEIQLFKTLGELRIQRLQRLYEQWCDFYQPHLDQLFSLCQRDPSFDLTYEEFCHWTFKNTDRPLARLRQDQKASWIRKAKSLLLVNPDSDPVSLSNTC